MKLLHVNNTIVQQICICFGHLFPLQETGGNFEASFIGSKREVVNLSGFKRSTILNRLMLEGRLIYATFHGQAQHFCYKLQA